MEIAFAPTVADAATIALPVRQDGLGAVNWGGLDAGAQAAAAATAARFAGEAGSIADLFVAVGEGYRHVLLLGIGAGQPGDWAKAGGALTAKLLVSGTTQVTVNLSALAEAPEAEGVARLAAAAAQRAWRHDAYRTKLSDKQKPTLATVTIAGAPDGTEAAWAAHAAVTEGMALTRTLVAEPPNLLYPETFVAQVREAFAGTAATIEVLGEDEMRSLGMGAILGVSQGSAREGQLLSIRWQGAEEEVDPSVALVGKGVTFDTGGISIKPGPGMEDMKWDMGGAGAVVGAMLALVKRNAKANVIGVCGLVENMPDGNATRPGDVLTSMSGQTIEVLNTDAEGRLVLADAITWVQRTHRVKTIVDLATLTGAMIVSLGNEYGGIFANDDALADQLRTAGEEVGDELWRFPLSKTYDKMIDSPIADMKNIGPRGAGSITAAQFIQRFVEDGVKWAHLDIAGMVWSDKPGTTYDKGATGYGVRLLDRFVRDNFEG